MVFKKILGLVLLFLGLIMIVSTVYYSYNIFTGKTEAPELFSVPEEVAIQPEEIPEDWSAEDYAGGALPIDFDALPKVLNLFAWGVFAFILIFAGGQVAGIGIKLMKQGN